MTINPIPTAITLDSIKNYQPPYLQNQKSNKAVICSTNVGQVTLILNKLHDDRFINTRDVNKRSMDVRHDVRYVICSVSSIRHISQSGRKGYEAEFFLVDGVRATHILTTFHDDRSIYRRVICRCSMDVWHQQQPPSISASCQKSIKGGEPFVFGLGPVRWTCFFMRWFAPMARSQLQRLRCLQLLGWIRLLNRLEPHVCSVETIVLDRLKPYVETKRFLGWDNRALSVKTVC